VTPGPSSSTVPASSLAFRERQGNWSHIFEEALADLPINGIDPGGIDTNEYLAGLRFRTPYLLQNELFRAAVGVEMDRSHQVIAHCSSLSACKRKTIEQ
jgi:hypothetical protein